MTGHHLEILAPAGCLTRLRTAVALATDAFAADAFAADAGAWIRAH